MAKLRPNQIHPLKQLIKKKKKAKKFKSTLKLVAKNYDSDKPTSPVILVTMQADLQWCFRKIAEHLSRNSNTNNY
jgi:hypothetical protein